MNERIRELEKQATDYYSNGQERIFDRQKFAELIVEECIDIVDTEEFGLMTQDRNYRIQTTKKIREHFGVEEWKSN